MDHDPTLPQYWSEHPRNKAFGANSNAFSSKFTGYSICHPIYHENTMYLAARHAIYSAALSTEASATFMFLPSCNKRMTTIPYAMLYRRFPRLYELWTPYHQTNWKEKKRKNSAGSDDTASMIKGGGYVGARTRKSSTAQTIKRN